MFFSIIMPVYNSGKYLEVAVRSLLNQDCPDFELFLIDDGSTDGSSTKCDQYAREDERVRVIHQKNAGMGFARNRAISMAKGQYVGFCDHDDEFLPGCLKKVKECLISTNADVIKFGCRELYIEGDKTFRVNDIVPLKNVFFGQDEIARGFLYKFDTDYMGYIWDGFYKRNLFKNEIMFNLDMRTGYEDEEIQMKMFPEISSIQYLSDIFYIHNIRSEFSNSKKHNSNQLEAMLIVAQAGTEAVKKLHIEKLIPGFSAVLIGRHLVTTIRCGVYADNKVDLKSFYKKIHDDPRICSFLKKEYIVKVWKKKKIWGVFYGLYTIKQYAILMILTKLLRIVRLKYR